MPKEELMKKFNKLLGSICADCPLCKYAREKPETKIGRLMEWHGKWCPAWKAYNEIEKENKLPK